MAYFVQRVLCLKTTLRSMDNTSSDDLKSDLQHHISNIIISNKSRIHPADQVIINPQQRVDLRIARTINQTLNGVSDESVLLAIELGEGISQNRPEIFHLF